MMVLTMLAVMVMMTSDGDSDDGDNDDNNDGDSSDGEMTKC